MTDEERFADLFAQLSRNLTAEFASLLPVVGTEVVEPVLGLSRKFLDELSKDPAQVWQEMFGLQKGSSDERRCLFTALLAVSMSEFARERRH